MSGEGSERDATDNSALFDQHQRFVIATTGSQRLCRTAAWTFECVEGDVHIEDEPHDVFWWHFGQLSAEHVAQVG